jgi:hypothetical protein
MLATDPALVPALPIFSAVSVAAALAGVLLMRRGSGARAPRDWSRIVVPSPVLGVMLLDERAGAAWGETDRDRIVPLFARVRESQRATPRCDVLLIYGDLDAEGRLAPAGAGLREVIRDAGAKVVVVASDNPRGHYVAGVPKTRYGRTNLVMTMDRRGDALPRFLAELFLRMGRGVSMPAAWVQLAPQAPGPEHDALPAVIFACELGHVVFEAPRAA